MQQSIEVIFIHKYNKNNPKEIKLFCMIYLAGDFYTIVADEKKSNRLLDSAFTILQFFTIFLLLLFFVVVVVVLFEFFKY